MQFLYFLTFFLLLTFSNQSKKFLHLGSATPYRFLKNDNVTQPKFEGCAPKKLWFVTRHGTRNPGASEIKNMKLVLTKLKDEILSHSNLSRHLIDSLQKWDLKLDEKDANQLREEGRIEMYLLARRLQKRFSDLLPSTFSNQSFLFKYTRSERTNDSAREFAVGLFGEEGAKNVHYDEGDDFVLRFYKYCKKWKVCVKNNPEAYVEQKLFDASSIVVSAVRALTEKLNLQTKLTTDIVKLMYLACAFETAWNERSSVWCRLLSLELMKIREFSDNLESYYVHGYGYNITYEEACPLFNDMIKHFTGTGPSPNAVIYFTHSGTILKFIAHLGLYRSDRPMMHGDFGNKYPWNQSKMDGFGSNVAFVLYKCGDRDHVAAFHQERLIKLPNCTEICDLKKLTEIYQKSINCDFEQMCKV